MTYYLTFIHPYMDLPCSKGKWLQWPDGWELMKRNYETSPCPLEDLCWREHVEGRHWKQEPVLSCYLSFWSQHICSNEDQFISTFRKETSIQSCNKQRCHNQACRMPRKEKKKLKEKAEQNDYSRQGHKTSPLKVIDPDTAWVSIRFLARLRNWV